MVEAFSIRGLALLADSWQHDPPFPHNAVYADAIRHYRSDLLDGYDKAVPADLAAWLRAGRPSPAPAIAAPKGPAVAPILAELERDKRCVEDMGAANRWQGRSTLPIADYLLAWQKSCAEVKAPGILPGRLLSCLDYPNDISANKTS